MSDLTDRITTEHRIEKQERPLFTGIDMGRVQCACDVWLDNIDAYTAHVAELTERAVREEIARDAEITPDELDALPVGSVVMSIMQDPHEQRVWQRFGGEPDWQFGMPRHDWQSTDGGFVRVGNSADLIGGGPRTLTLLARGGAR